MFYFAWVDAEETTFGPEHIRNDETPFSLEIQHTEGDLPALDVEIVNPRVGLLAPGRKRWAWVSYRKVDTTVVPIFFGRLVGMPNDLQGNMVRLTLVARPVDYEAAKAALAEALRVAPYYDPIWLSEEERADPDNVLEGRSALWHVDRVTHALTVSDIVAGEDSQLDYDEDVAFYDSLRVSFGESPARRVVLTASVNWSQEGSGDVDITKDLIQAFRTEGFPGLYSITGESRNADGVIAVVPGEDLMNSWPKFGDSIGGGWTVGQSSATLVGEVPLPPILLENQAAYDAIRSWFRFNKGNKFTLGRIFERSPGFVVDIQDTTSKTVKSLYGDWNMFAHGDVNIMWVPVWRIAPVLKLHWSVQRDRTENITITMDADVQDVIAEPGEDAIIYMDAGSGEAAPSRRKEYFSTDRGRQSVANLIARARAALLMRARCVDVAFAVPFEDGLDLSCRRNASIQDPRLPGGIAAGKVKSYSLSVDGGTGEKVAHVTIACSVGQDGEVTAVPGTPTYVNAGYVNAGYQETPDEVLVPIPGAVGYSLAYTAADDGVNLFSIGKDYMTSLTVDGTLEQQQEAAQEGDVAVDSAETFDRINGYKTTIRLTMRPVTGGPFVTPVVPVLTELKIPRTINLEAPAA